MMKWQKLARRDSTGAKKILADLTPKSQSPSLPHFGKRYTQWTVQKWYKEHSSLCLSWNMSRQVSRLFSLISLHTVFHPSQRGNLKEGKRQETHHTTHTCVSFCGIFSPASLISPTSYIALEFLSKRELTRWWITSQEKEKWKTKRN